MVMGDTHGNIECLEERAEEREDDASLRRQPAVSPMRACHKPELKFGKPPNKRTELFILTRG